MTAGPPLPDPSAAARQREQARDLAFAHSIDHRITTLLAPRPGDRYLDVGCGTGEDTRALAALVGLPGLVVGLDIGAAALATAREHAAASQLPIQFLRADAAHSPFLDAVFVGCREERLLLHMNDPGQVVAEMARVTRSGGRVVACEPDWGTAVIHGASPATSRLVLDAWARNLRHGFVGSALPGLFATAGLLDIAVEPFTEFSRLAGYPSARDQQDWDVTGLARSAQSLGALSAESASIWLDELDASVRQGAFFMSLTCFLVSGTKP